VTSGTGRFSAVGAFVKSIAPFAKAIDTFAESSGLFVDGIVLLAATADAFAKASALQGRSIAVIGDTISAIAVALFDVMSARRTSCGNVSHGSFRSRPGACRLRLDRR
jgi:hypothetical protein